MFPTMAVYYKYLEFKKHRLAVSRPDQLEKSLDIEFKRGHFLKSQTWVLLTETQWPNTVTLLYFKSRKKSHNPLFFGIGSWEESVTQYGSIVFDQGDVLLKIFTDK